MQPIVNGLEIEFGERAVFERIDANQDDGQRRLRQYGLRGHPSYAILAEDGALLWSATGQLPEALLRRQIQAILAGI